MVPATVARQTREPSSAVSTRWVGCHVVSSTRAATDGVNRRTTWVDAWSAMMSHAPRRAFSRDPASGGSKVRGVSATSRIRSILKVRSALRVSSHPIR